MSQETISNSVKNVNEVNQWDLVRDAYHGQGGFKSGAYLLEHAKEDDFEGRKGYSFYLNYFKPIIKARVDPIYQNPPERYNESKSKEWELFEKDCDNKGNSLTQVMKGAAL